MKEIDDLARDIEREHRDTNLRFMARDMGVYYAALRAEGFREEDALVILLAWQTLMLMDGED